MADKVIAVKLTADTEDAAKNVLKLQGIVATLRAEFKKAQAGSDEQIAALKKLQVAEAELTKTTNDFSAANQKGTGHFKGLKDSVTSLPGPLGQAGAGVNTLSNTFKALLANPVGLVLAAIVGILTLLYKAFTNTFEGGQKVEQVFAGIKAAAQSLLDNLDKIGSAIVKVFTLDFSGAIDDIKGVVNAAVEAGNAMARLTATAQKLKVEQLQNDLDAAERQKKLAILREQAGDDSVPTAARKKALLDLRAESEANAKQDIDLAKRTAENKIAQLTLEKDGAKKNAEEITAIRIEQINGETDNANELRRIGKQVTTIEKQELAERKEARAKANEAAKAEREKLAAFNTQLLKLQQENELALIKDAAAKELAALEQKISNEKAANEKALKARSITRAQYQQIDDELDKKALLDRTVLIDKQNTELRKKEEEAAKEEEAFQKELNSIRTKTKLDGIRDSREAERVALQIAAEEQVQEAIVKYKDDQTRFQEIKNAIDEQLKAEQALLDEKNKEEDAKKKLQGAEGETDAVLNDPEAVYSQKKAALDAEQQAIQEAFDARAISEEQYNARTRDLHGARMQLDEAEKAQRLDTLGKIGDAFGSLSTIVGKQTALGKTLAVAQATISMIQGAVSSYTSLAPIPIVGPALGAVAAGAAVVSGIANIKKIVSVQVPGGGGGGGAAPSVSVPTQAAPVAPKVAGTQIDQASVDRMNDAKMEKPTRAYVVDADVGTAREKQARLENAARLGG